MIQSTILVNVGFGAQLQFIVVIKDIRIIKLWKFYIKLVCIMIRLA